MLDSKMRLLKITDKLTTSFVEAKRTIIVKRKYVLISSIFYYYDYEKYFLYFERYERTRVQARNLILR